MEQNQLLTFVMMLLVLLLGGWRSCHGCWDHERDALLQIKASFGYPTYLLSWGIDADCCKWDFVNCNNSTGRIAALGAHRGYDNKADFYLNASLFLPFKELERLDLSANRILGFFETEGLERLSELHNLKILDLSRNSFNNTILSSLESLFFLKELDVSYNSLNGSINIQELNNLKNLEVLDLSYNEIRAFKSYDGLEGLFELDNLKILNLSWNSFRNNILSSLRSLSSLKKLDLSGNRLNGSINIQELNNLKNMEVLDLSYNEIRAFKSYDGLEGLFELDNLKILDLSGNSFGNNILSSLRSLSSLKKLELRRNRLNGSINIQELNNLKNLEVLDLSYNEIRAFKSYDGLKGLFELNNLKILDLSVNSFSNTILSSLGSLSSLKELDLSYNSLNESIKIQELNNLKNLVMLNLSNNQIRAFNSCDGDEDVSQLINLKFLELHDNLFHNDILLFIKRIPTLRDIGLGYNSLQGVLNMTAFDGFSDLKRLDLGGNQINEIVVSKELKNMKNLGVLDLSYNQIQAFKSYDGICNFKRLQELDLSGNGLNGTLPRCLANLTSLQELYLSSNHFVRDISSSPLISLTNIRSLALSDNHFRIPGSLWPFHNHSKLKYLDVWANEIYAETEVPDLAPKFQLETLFLSGYGYRGSFPKFLYHQHDLQLCYLFGLQMRGEFPNWLIDNNTKLAILDLSNNSLSGPLQLPGNANSMLWSLGISDNHFDGHIPAEICSYLPRLGELGLDGNELTGSFPSSMSNCSSLQFFSAKDNHLSGNIPSWFKNLSDLEILDISGNYFSGSLPSGSVPMGITHLHLSRNKLQGSLENVLPYHLPKIEVLDLSHNSFIGGIPKRIGGFSELKYLLLSHNNFEGKIPVRLCKLESLSTLDVSHNNFYSHIPPCLGSNNEKQLRSSYRLENVELTTKGMSYFYSLEQFVPLFDFSCNNFTGNIPPEFGKFSNIRSMNLSHNHLTGPIPPTFANLTQIETLDLSYNNLNGTIPPQLIGLTFLSAFSVAHNNLSGRIPEGVAQFGTFEKRCYEGNLFLCGWPLSNCSTNQSLSPVPTTSTEENEESGLTEMEVFWVSFGVAYIILLLTIAAVLYINPYWRRAWLYYIELWMTDCYYFVLDNVSLLLSKFRF